jgi:hypothetical protein
MQMPETTNIYGDIHDLEEFRSLYSELKDQIPLADSRHALDEIKERSEYLATLADNPVWRDALDRGGEEALDIARREDPEVARLLNEKARELNVGGEAYMPWRPGDDSNVTRNV